VAMVCWEIGWKRLWRGLSSFDTKSDAEDELTALCCSEPCSMTFWPQMSYLTIDIRIEL
jgi:hypothetical protein